MGKCKAESIERQKQALKLLELLPQLLMGDIETLIMLAKAGQYEEARRLAKKLKKSGLFGFG